MNGERFVRVLGLVFCVGAGVTGCDRAVSSAAATPRAETARPVRLGAVERGDVTRPIRGAGLVIAKHQADLAFKVGGVVSAMTVEEGARVKRGQVLARIDPTEISAGAVQARRGAEQAERDLERARALADASTLPRARLESIETSAAIARSAATMASFNEKHTVLVAPSDGIVERRLVEAGEVVAPGRPAVRFLGTQRGFAVTVAVSDRDALRVVPGAVAKITFDAAPGVIASGAVTDVARLGNPRTGTFDVEIALPADLPFEPRSGLVAKVELPRVEVTPAHVPLAALVDVDGDRAAVFRLDGEQARRVPVRVAFLFADRVALQDDLPGVEQVVIEGQHDLVDGGAARVSAVAAP